MFKKLILSLSFFALVNAEDYSLKFDGLDDYIDFGTNSSTEISGDLSIVAWFKFDDFSNSLSTVLMKESTSLSDNNAYGINKTWNGNGLDFVVGDGNTTNIVSTQELQAGQWYHLVCTNDGNYSRVYVDGVMHNEIESGNPLAPNADLKIGLHSTISNQDRFWKGNIDDVSLWNVALSQEQVENLYQNNPLGTEQGLIAHWNFNGGSGPLLLDHSGNNNHGIIYGAEWSDDVPTIDPPPFEENFSLQFDGEDDYVVSSGNMNMDFTNGVSVEFNFKTEHINGDHGYMVSQYSHANLAANNACVEFSIVDGHLSYHLRDNAGTEIGYTVYDLTVADNLWHSVQFVYDGLNNHVNLSIDEQTYYSGNVTNLGSIVSPSPLYLGNQQYHDWHYQGYISGVKVWNAVVNFDNYNHAHNNSLVIEYPFGSGSGSLVLDHSGNNNHGIIYGAEWSDDVPTMDPPPFEENHSLSFDGNGDYVDLGNSSLFDFQYGDPFTISMWIHPNSLGGDAGLISKMADGGPVQYDVITAGASIRYGTGDQFLFGGQLEVGNWYHLIVTSDGSAKYIYINNQLIESGTFESMTSNGDNLYIGAHQPLSMPGWSWNGFIDEVSIWNVTLSQSEIEDNVTNDLNGNENGLVSYYKFNEGEGTTLTDLSGNGNHGTINGAEWSNNVPNMDPPPPPSEENHSLSFDGGSDYVEINSNNDIVSSNNGVSINLYFKKQDFGGHQFLYDWGVYSGANISDALRMKIDNGGVLEAWVEGNPGYNAPSLTYDLNSNEMNLQDTWVQVSVVYGMNRSKLYVNGSLVSEVTNGMSDNDLYRIFDQSGAWYWIGDQGDNQYGFNGLIDEFSIWSKELSDLDVQSIQNMALSPNEENLVAYWKFNEGQGNIVHDQSGNDYHGAVHGAEWSDEGAPVMPSSLASVEVGTAQAAPNSEVLVPVLVDLMYESVSSVEISFSGFHDQMEFVGLETEGTMTGDAEWSSAVNSEEDLLLTLTYGANEIVGLGTLFHLKFQVLDNVTGEFIPVVIEYVQMDELDGHIDVMNGGVELYDLDWGDVSQNGEISGFDASLILKHLVGMEELDELQLTVADVTQDNTISALDASAIAQYVVNMIDELPVANMDAMTGRGNFYFEELSLVPGELLEVPIQLVNGDNLLSFEMEVDYDQETFTLEELVWSDLIEHFTVEENLESGSVKIAGMGATPDGQEGVFGTIRFYVNPDFSDPNTQVNIGYRINEQSAVDDVNLVIQNAVLGLENEMIPNEFTIGQNYPNPFNPTTRIDYGLPEESMVDITIYDMMGRVVSKLVKSRLGAGYHSVTWDATNNAGDPVSAGMYFYTVQAGEYRVTNKMLLLK